MTTLGKRIKKAREQAGISQVDLWLSLREVPGLGSALKSQSTISRIESDKAAATSLLIGAIAKVCGVPVAQLDQDAADEIEALRATLSALDTSGDPEGTGGAMGFAREYVAAGQLVCA